MRQWREHNGAWRSLKASARSSKKGGIPPHAYNISFKDDFSEAEIERGFDFAKVLGTNIITASANTKVVNRVVPVAPASDVVAHAQSFADRSE